MRIAHAALSCRRSAVGAASEIAAHRQASSWPAEAAASPKLCPHADLTSALSALANPHRSWHPLYSSDLSLAVYAALQTSQCDGSNRTTLADDTQYLRSTLMACAGDGARNALHEILSASTACASWTPAYDLDEHDDVELVLAPARPAARQHQPRGSIAERRRRDGQRRVKRRA